MERLFVDTQHVEDAIEVLDHLVTRGVERVTKVRITVLVRNQKKVTWFLDSYNVIICGTNATNDVQRNHLPE
jgi:hypothetical protein